MRIAERVRFTLAGREVAKEIAHQAGGLRVGNLPQRRDHRLRPGQLKGLSQTGHAFAVADLPQARFASRKHDQLRPTQVGPDDLQSGQDPIVAVLRPGTRVAAGQEQPAAEQGVFQRLARDGQRRAARLARRDGSIVAFDFLILQEKSVRAQDGDLRVEQFLKDRLQRVLILIDRRRHAREGLQFRRDRGRLGGRAPQPRHMPQRIQRGIVRHSTKGIAAGQWISPQHGVRGGRDLVGRQVIIRIGEDDRRGRFGDRTRLDDQIAAADDVADVVLFDGVTILPRPPGEG